jgi:WD40 repeat protein
MICGDSIDIHDGFILTGQYDDKKQLQLWYLHNGELAEDIPFNDKLPSEKQCSVFTCQFQKNTHDLIIAGGSGSNEVKIFDGDSAYEPFEPCFKIKNLSRPCLSVDFSNSGDMFACGGGDGVIRCFNVVNES